MFQADLLKTRNIWARISQVLMRRGGGDTTDSRQILQGCRLVGATVRVIDLGCGGEDVWIIGVDASGSGTEDFWEEGNV